jgi:hypothetical protein
MYRNGVVYQSHSINPMALSEKPCFVCDASDDGLRLAGDAMFGVEMEVARDVPSRRLDTGISADG